MHSAIPPRNDVELTRDRLIYVLEYLSTLLPIHFPHPVRLVAHGGTCMLLHPGLHKLAQHQAQLTPNTPPRQTARNVSYIGRSFVTEWLRLGVPDASQKLQLCIHQTALALKLGADWMNSDADIALPMATDPNGKQFDPIFAASIQKNNVDLHTIYTSQNGMLTLISVAPFWAVALKLVRYTKWDPGDICLLLKYGTVLSGTQWSPEMLESWLTTYCWTMGYAHYDAQRKSDMRKRINHAIQMVNMWCSPDQDVSMDTVRSLKRRVSADTAMGAGGLDKAQAEWGGGDRCGWEAMFVGNWIRPSSPPRQIHQHQQQQLTSLPSALPPPHQAEHSGIPQPPHIANPNPPPSIHSHPQFQPHPHPISHLPSQSQSTTAPRRSSKDPRALASNITAWDMPTSSRRRDASGPWVASAPGLFRKQLDFQGDPPMAPAGNQRDISFPEGNITMAPIPHPPQGIFQRLGQAQEMGEIPGHSAIQVLERESFSDAESTVQSSIVMSLSGSDAGVSHYSSS